MSWGVLKIPLPMITPSMIPVAPKNPMVRGRSGALPDA
jgi:hypothetical protein